MITRNDITIAIVRLNDDRIVLRTAQGAAQHNIGKNGEIIDKKSDLYYSQIRCRSGVLHDTNYYIMTTAFAHRHYSQPQEKVVEFPMPIGGGKISETRFE